MYGRLALSILVLGSVAGAQDIGDLRNALRDAIRNSKFVKSAAGLIELSNELELSGASITLDDEDGTKLSSIVLPFQRSLDAFDSKVVGLYVEGVLGYATAKQFDNDIYDGGTPAIATSVDLKWTTFGGLLGLGPEFKLAEGLKLALIANGGLARIENQAKYGGPGADLTQSFADGIAFNWKAMTWSAGGAARIEWVKPFARRYEASVIVRYDLRWIGVFAADDSAQEFTSRGQIVTVRGDLVGPLGWKIADGDLYWRLTGGYSRFLEGSIYGADEFFEIGGSIELDVAESLPVGRRVSISVAIIFGENLTGWSIGAGIEF